MVRMFISQTVWKRRFKKARWFCSGQRMSIAIYRRWPMHFSLSIWLSPKKWSRRLSVFLVSVLTAFWFRQTSIRAALFEKAANLSVYRCRSIRWCCFPRWTLNITTPCLASHRWMCSVVFSGKPSCMTTWIIPRGSEIWCSRCKRKQVTLVAFKRCENIQIFARVSLPSVQEISANLANRLSQCHSIGWSCAKAHLYQRWNHWDSFGYCLWQPVALLSPVQGAVWDVAAHVSQAFGTPQQPAVKGAGNRRITLLFAETVAVTASWQIKRMVTDWSCAPWFTHTASTALAVWWSLTTTPLAFSWSMQA